MNREEFSSISKLVKGFTKKFCYRYRVKDAEELEGYLMEKIVIILRKFTPDRGVDFKHYANKCLTGYSYNFLRDKCRIVKVPRKYSDLNLKYQRYLRKNSTTDNNKNRQNFLLIHKDITKELLFEALEATSSTFTEITDYHQCKSILFSTGESYNPFCKDYLSSIPQRDIEILQDIFVSERKPERVFLEWGLSPVKGYKLISHHVSELRKLQSSN